jgi:hypothetical protein
MPSEESELQISDPRKPEAPKTDITLELYCLEILARGFLVLNALKPYSCSKFLNLGRVSQAPQHH